MKIADTIIRGTIYTANRGGDFAEAIAVKDGVILYVGSSEGVQQYMGSGTDVIDAGNGLVTPGFIDVHAHPAAATDILYAIDLTELNSRETYLEKIRGVYIESPNSNLLYGFGWGMDVFGIEGPKAADLDEITDRIPIVLWDLGYHNMWVNSAALKMAGFIQDKNDYDSNVPRDEEGNPTGLIKEAATEEIIRTLPGYTVEQCRNGIKAYQKMAVSYGHTAVFDGCVYNAEEKLGYPGNNSLRAYEELAGAGELIMKTKSCVVIDSPERDSYERNLEYLQNVSKRVKDEFFEIDTAKYYLDGAIEGKTAFLLEPYADSPGFCGNSNWGAWEFCDACTKTADKGLRIHIHAIGDGAVKQGLDGIQAASEKTGNTGLRHIITHLQLVDEADFQRFAKFNVIAAVQPYWFHKDGMYDVVKEMTGQKRADLQYPMKKFYDNGIRVASSSDHPVTPVPRPLEAMEIAVTRCDPGDSSEATMLAPAQERISLETALRSFTIDAAYALFMDDKTGSLEVGKKADLVILDRNIFELPVHEIAAAREMATMINGKIVYRRDTSR